MLSNRTLAKIAAYGGVIVATTGFYLQFKIQDRVKSNEYYRQALKILRGHPGAVSLLGEPIKDGSFDLGDTEKNFCDGQTARFQLPVKGSKEKGVLYFWADRIQEEWKVNKMELQLQSDPDRRLLIVKEDNS